MPESKRSTSRLRRWLDKRREGQRRGAEMEQRRKAAHKEDSRRAERRGGPRTGDPGSFGGM